MNKVTPEERYYACVLHRVGVSTNSLANELGRGWETIQGMYDPEKAKASRKKSSEKWRAKNPNWMNDYYSKNRETIIAKMMRYEKTEGGQEKRKRYRSSDKGKAMEKNNGVINRLKKTNSPEEVFLDGQWFEVDRKLTYEIWGELLLPYDERQVIREIYKTCDLRTKRTGIEHHVDHIQPLSKGGLHLAINLQIITADENLRKHNTFRKEDQELLASRYFNLN